MIIIDKNKHGIRRETNTDKVNSKNKKRKANDEKIKAKWNSKKAK
jgi:hypothetical protein